MLTRTIVDLYAWIIEIGLWAILIGGGVLGFLFFGPALDEAGFAMEHAPSWSIVGAALGSAMAFLLAALLVGPVVILVDIRRSIRAIESRTVPSMPDERPAPPPPNPFAFDDLSSL